MSIDYVDGGRSRAVRRGLTPLVRDIRTRLGLDVSLVLYQSPSSPGAYVLASDAVKGVSLPLPNEPLLVHGALASRRPASLHDIELHSAVRRFSLSLAAGLVVPWSQDSGRGWLVAGMLPRRWTGKSLDLGEAVALSAEVSRCHRLASLQGTSDLRHNINQAMRRIHEAQLEEPRVETALQTIISVARGLLGTAAAYVSMPDESGSEFLFTHLDNIHTSAFRRLRMGPGAGLGGLAREELHAVRSLNYAHDARLRSAPVAETLGEGIQSAMCAPLLTAGGDLLGLLYVANRRLTPYTEVDAAVLDEYAGFAATALEQREAEEHRLSVMRRLEQERLAFELHDSLVRDLMEIGFTAEAGLSTTHDSALRRQLEAIGRTAEQCLEKVRDEITRMASSREMSDRSSIGEIIEELRAMHSYEAIERSFIVGGSTRTTLPAAVASALVQIGQEAIENSERHSGASKIDIRLCVDATVATLRVSDDGTGIDDEWLERATADRSGHLGLRRMRMLARQHRGSLVLQPGETSGLTVEVRIPMDPDS